MRILAISGSLREASYNTLLAHAAAALAPAGVEVEVYDGLGSLPLYDADLDGEDAPAPVRELRERIADADAVLFVTPEYNGSVPGVLKNAVDWASRPGHKSVLSGKPVAIIGAASGVVGTARAQIHLREIMFSTLARVMPHPGVLVNLAPQKFQDGRLADEPTRVFLADYLRAFGAYVDQMGTG